MDFDKQLDALLDSAEAEGQNPLEIHQRIQEKKRKRSHAKAKAAQPEIGIRGAAQHEEWFSALKAAWETPLQEVDTDAGPGAMDYLLLTIQDTMAGEDLEDAVFSMMRVCRKAWAWNQAHLGPISAPKAS